MTQIETDLQTLEQLYDLVEQQLEIQKREIDAGRPASLERAAAGENLQDRIASLEQRIRARVEAGDADGSHGGRGASEVSSRAAAARVKCGRLIKSIEQNAQRLRSLQNAARASLQRLQAGGQFLESMRGAREAPPRYVDARQ
jgi:chromosome segregation ATPase